MGSLKRFCVLVLRDADYEVIAYDPTGNVSLEQESESAEPLHLSEGRLIADDAEHPLRKTLVMGHCVAPGGWGARGVHLTRGRLRGIKVTALPDPDYDVHGVVCGGVDEV